MKKVIQKTKKVEVKPEFKLTEKRLDLISLISNIVKPTTEKLLVKTKLNKNTLRSHIKDLMDEKLIVALKAKKTVKKLKGKIICEYNIYSISKIGKEKIISLKNKLNKIKL